MKFLLLLMLLGSAEARQQIPFGFFRPSTVVPPAFVAYSDAMTTATQGSITINKPSGTQSGDLLIAAMVNYTGSSVTPPSGWTQQQSYFWPSYTYYTTVFTKTAGGSEPASYTFTVSAVNGYRAMIVAYRSASYLSIGSTSETASTPISVPSVSGTQDQDLCLTIAFDRSTGSLSSSGGTQRYADTAGAYWSGLVYETVVTGSSSGIVSVSRGAVVNSAAGVNVILRGQ